MGLLRRWRRRRARAQLPPRVVIVEKHEATDSPGPGVRTCYECGTMWRSDLGELMDSGPDATGSDGKVFASWDELLGLTCTMCRRSVCRDHLEQPDTAEGVPQPSHYRCAYCGDRMDLA